MILLAMAIGAGIGALAGTLVYGAKVALSKETTWNWKDAAAAAGGGLVGGALFPPLLAGLAAIGLPTAAAYIVAGGVAWGGVWTLAEDAARWGLGRAPGLGSVWRYLGATAIGMAVTAMLLPIASRVVKPGGLLKPHTGTPEAFLTPAKPVAPNVLKAEVEFLAYGAAAETANRGIRALINNAGRDVARRAAVAGGSGTGRMVTPDANTSIDFDGISPFAHFRERYPVIVVDPSEPPTLGAIQALERRTAGAE